MSIFTRAIVALGLMQLAACGSDAFKKVEKTETSIEDLSGEQSPPSQPYDNDNQVPARGDNASDITAAGTYALRVDVAMFINNEEDYCNEYATDGDLAACQDEYTQLAETIETLLSSSELPTTQWLIAAQIEKDANDRLSGVGCLLQTESGTSIDGRYSSESQICVIDLKPQYGYDLFSNSERLLVSVAYLVIDLINLELYAVDQDTQNYATLGTLSPLQ